MLSGRVGDLAAALSDGLGWRRIGGVRQNYRLGLPIAGPRCDARLNFGRFMLGMFKGCDSLLAQLGDGSAWCQLLR
jgi:hypothetical protein